MMKSTSAPLVSICLLNWNGSHETLQCLQALSGNLYSPLEILILDNGSRSEDRVALEEGLKRFSALPLRFTAVPENLGFAGGVNRLLKEVDPAAKYLVLLNNDAYLEPDTLGALVDAAERFPYYGVLGPVIYPALEGDDSPPLTMGWIHPFSGATPFSHHLPPEEVSSCHLVHGCCFFIRKELMDEWGPLDEGYFAYYEETDLCFKIARSGYELGVVRAASIRHEGSTTSKRVSGLLEYLMMRNRLRFILKNIRGGTRVSAILISLFVYGTKRALRALLLRQWVGVRAVIRGIRDGLFDRPVNLKF